MIPKLRIYLIFLLIFLSWHCKTNQERQAKVQTFSTESNPNAPKRIISLVPSITEILFAIGADSAIIAVSQACNFPIQAKQKHIIQTYPSIDYEKIMMLKPDLVLGSSEILPTQSLNRLKSLKIKVQYIDYYKVSDIVKSIKEIGQLIDKEQIAIKLCDSLSTILSALEPASRNYPKPRLMVLISSNPIIIAGQNSFINDEIKLAGGINIADSSLIGSYPQVSREYILNKNPDFIFGASFTILDSSFFELYPELKHIGAYKSKSIFDMDQDLLFRPSPRFTETILQIYNKIHVKRSNG